jgi:DNA polymerase/3'-5' exonuclease PolX
MNKKQILESLTILPYNEQQIVLGDSLQKAATPEIKPLVLELLSIRGIGELSALEILFKIAMAID